MSAFPELKANEFPTPRFSKSEYNWFRRVTSRFRAQDVIADIPTVTQTAGPQTYVAVTAPNANAQGVLYVQADVQTIATLANALKVAFNALVAQLQTQNDQFLADDTAVTDALNQALTALSSTPVQT